MRPLVLVAMAALSCSVNHRGLNIPPDDGPISRVPTDAADHPRDSSAPAPDLGELDSIMFAKPDTHEFSDNHNLSPSDSTEDTSVSPSDTPLDDRRDTFNDIVPRAPRDASPESKQECPASCSRGCHVGCDREGKCRTCSTCTCSDNNRNCHC